MKNKYNKIATVLWLVGLLMLLPVVLGVVTSEPSIFEPLIYSFPTKTTSTRVFSDRIVIISVLAYISLIFAFIFKVIYCTKYVPPVKKEDISIKSVIKSVVKFIFKMLMVLMTISILLISFIGTMIAFIDVSGSPL